jgi:hypothetical protein
MPTALVVPTAERDCRLPAGWTTYTASAGESLYSLALAVESSVEELTAGNCLETSDNIPVGMDVYVPRSPANAVATSAPVYSTGTPPAPQGCTAPGVLIISPTAGAEVTGVFSLVGAAAIVEGGSYRIDIRAAGDPIYNPYSRSDEAVVGGVLAEINSDLYGDGLHWVRLTVYDENRTPTQSCAIPVIFD